MCLPTHPKLPFFKKLTRCRSLLLNNQLNSFRSFSHGLISFLCLYSLPSLRSQHTFGLTPISKAKSWRWSDIDYRDTSGIQPLHPPSHWQKWSLCPNTLSFIPEWVCFKAHWGEGENTIQLGIPKIWRKTSLPPGSQQSLGNEGHRGLFLPSSLSKVTPTGDSGGEQCWALLTQGFAFCVTVGGWA